MESTQRKFSFDNKNGKRIRKYSNDYTSGPVPCTNCGIVGHSNRQCTSPITSYGVIAFRVKNDNWSLRKTLCSDDKVIKMPIITGYEQSGGFEFLLIRRRDSLRFVEFIRGKYNCDDEVYLYQMIENMTRAEQDKIREHTFDELWAMVWGSSHNQSRAYKNDYESSKDKFNKISIKDENGESILSTILSTVSSPWIEPEWGFPKGRRNPREDDKTAALREFSEETGINHYDYEVIDNIEPISETFYGDNHVYYCHKYYMAHCNRNVELKLHDDDEQMTREISEIGWFSLDDALNKIRPENIEKREILLRASAFLRNYCPMPSKVF